MQIILTDKVTNLGNFGDRVSVKAGYVRNFLIPKGKAVLATKKNIEYFKIRCDELNAKLTEALAIAKSRAEKINALSSIIIKSKAGNEGKLFGSVGARDIADAMAVAGIEINRNEVRLPNGAFRATGTYEVILQIHNEISARITVEIIPDKS